ncbi:BAR-domain-containing protein [Rhizodiscina lignyota]|uniref:BAR-domain-containing protein n=1 Tax=Rhizodiscina lignyota TaxID=1504668 RepID=A0A9P4IBJ0_9PEZI|nr:BAR-domain-containing protein [Rhizodiscina lignyota]
MNLNKRLDRMKQWAGEKMGGEVKTSTSDEFKALEVEMNLRHDGMERMHKSMTAYVKSVSKRSEGEERDKLLPIGYLGQSMVGHGQDFNHDSEFGNCLIAMGRANENLARKQEAYVAHATSTWLESLERSLAQMKEYQAARKKLEQRRLAYDASLAKMQKAKREDFRFEEELRSQKAKYEEANEEVYRRMEDIKEAESESVADITAFLDSELAFHENCRDILMKVKRDWPAGAGASGLTPARNGRSRSNTAHSYSERFNRVEEEAPPEPRMTIPARMPSRDHSESRVSNVIRPTYNRANTDTNRDYSPAPRISRMPTEPTAMLAGRTNLRPVKRAFRFTDYIACKLRIASRQLHEHGHWSCRKRKEGAPTTTSVKIKEAGATSTANETIYTEHIGDPAGLNEIRCLHISAARMNILFS